MFMTPPWYRPMEPDNCTDTDTLAVAKEQIMDIARTLPPLPKLCKCASSAPSWPPPPFHHITVQWSGLMHDGQPSMLIRSPHQPLDLIQICWFAELSEECSDQHPGAVLWDPDEQGYLVDACLLERVLSQAARGTTFVEFVRGGSLQ